MRGSEGMFKAHQDVGRHLEIECRWPQWFSRVMLSAKGRSFRGLIGIALVVLILSGCGISKAPKAIMLRARSMTGSRVDVRVIVAPDANQNSPLAVDLLYVYDAKLLDQLLKLNASEWFAQRKQLKRDLLPGEGAEIWSWEWVPGQQIPIQQLPIKTSAEAGLVFANYLTPGNHRFRIDPFEDIVIQLGERDLTVETEAALKDRLSKAKTRLLEAKEDLPQKADEASDSSFDKADDYSEEAKKFLPPSMTQ